MSQPGIRHQCTFMKFSSQPDCQALTWRPLPAARVERRQRPRYRHAQPQTGRRSRGFLDVSFDGARCRRGLWSLSPRLLEEDLRGEALDGDLAGLVVDDEHAVLLVRVLDVTAGRIGSTFEHTYGYTVGIGYCDYLGTRAK